jgi:phosphate transport system substrate-binding protein
MKRYIYLIILAALALTAAAYVFISHNEASAASAATIAIDGSSTVYPITEAVAEDFQKGNKGIQVTVGISGTGGGMKKFVRGELDICDASRPITPSEIQQAKGAGIGFVELPIAYDGVTVVVNAANTWCRSMSVVELKKLWAPEAKGKIKKWSDIRPGWPVKDIHLYGPGTDSGTFEFFTGAIVGKAKSSRPDYTASEDDNVLVQGVARDQYALGYFGMAYYEENKDKLKAVMIDDGKDENGVGPIGVSAKTVANGTYAPLSRPLFIYVNSKVDQRLDVVKFVDFYLANAKQLSAEVGYVALSDKLYNAIKQRWANRTAGTLYSDPSNNTKPLSKVMGVK